MHHTLKEEIAGTFSGLDELKTASLPISSGFSIEALASDGVART